eukprot:5389868-Lingulodinium_polyedra.AAC.1
MASSRQSQHQQFLQQLQVDFAAYQEACKRAPGDRFWERLVQMSPFSTCFMYEVACAAVAPALRSNQALVTDLHQLASAIFGSFGQTKVVEDVFQRLRRREETDTTCKNLEPSRAWAIAAEAK